MLFSVLTQSNHWSDQRVVAQSLKTGERRLLVRGASNARYLPTGHIDCRVVFAMDKALSAPARRDSVKTIDSAAFSSLFGAAKVPAAVFAKAPSQTRPQRSRGRHRSGCCGDEAAESELGMPSYCRADRLSLWYSYE